MRREAIDGIRFCNGLPGSRQIGLSQLTVRVRLSQIMEPFCEARSCQLLALVVTNPHITSPQYNRCYDRVAVTYVRGGATARS